MIGNLKYLLSAENFAVVNFPHFEIQTFIIWFDISGDYLITKQTTAEGRICNSVMITERKYTRKEYYLAFMNERAFSVSKHFHINDLGIFVH